VYGTWVIKRACKYTVIFKVRRATVSGVLERDCGRLACWNRAAAAAGVRAWALVRRITRWCIATAASMRTARCSAAALEYLHAMLGIQPPEFTNNSLSEEVYSRGPFPIPTWGWQRGLTGQLDAAVCDQPCAAGFAGLRRGGGGRWRRDSEAARPGP